ncbi:MAG: deoxyhypusine synthase family protein [Deltaproteobacteria bacterium]|nr:deoxyhypusine synthase family protein [Deltaproteobacteria bacterium]
MHDKHDHKGSHDCASRLVNKAEQDGLEPVLPLDLSACGDFDELTASMARTAFGGRSLGEAVDVLVKMARDPDCQVVLTLAGAMTVAKMGLVICDMIDHGLVQAVVSTGALMAHGFVESTGLAHYKYREGMDDAALYERGYNRVYDTLEPESNLEHVEQILWAILRSWDTSETLCSQKLNDKLGQYLAEHHPDTRGVLKSARNKGVPVYVPAFSDSEIGLGVAIFNREQALAGKPRIHFDPLLDLEHYSSAIAKVSRLGIFTIGGGVPRNWAQQVGPFLEIIERSLGEKGGGKITRFHYGVRICPEPVHWGGLSGCTYSEGVSWGKFVPPSKGGRFAEVYSDATIAWPIVVKAALQRLAKSGGAAPKKPFVGEHIWKP